jgi:hypothetical protein
VYLSGILPDGELCAISPSSYRLRMRDRETIDFELRLVAAFRRAARKRGGPLPSINLADALLDELGGLAANANELDATRP